MTRHLVVVVGLLCAMAANAQESPAALLGNDSQSNGGGAPTEVGRALRRAHEAAARGSGTLTVEHLLLELLEEPSAQKLLAEQLVNVGSLRTQLQYHIETRAGVERSAGAPVIVDSKYRNALQRAYLKSVLENRKEASAGEFVLAILVEGDSFAANALREHGLTTEEAQNAVLEQYLRTAKEQAERFEELRQRVQTERDESTSSSAALARQPAFASNAAPSTGADEATDRQPQEFTLRVAGREGTRFKAAVSRDGELDLHIETVPFETQFVASRVVVLFETIDGARGLDVSLLAERDGHLRTVGSVNGCSGAVFEDVMNRSRQRSGRL